MAQKYDFLIIGSGIAGLSFALKVADYGKVCLLTKANLDDTNTRYAQGGIAAVTYQPDNFEKHIQDTLICGDGVCDEEVVRMVIEEAPKQIKELIKWGVCFDRKPDGGYDLNREGGHSEHRILHHKDNTGEEIERALCAKVRSNQNIEIKEHYFALELITQHHLGELVKRSRADIECYGAYAIDFTTHKVETILSKVTILATGGSGNLYNTTTNPPTATGDGVAMTYRAKGLIENMEFVQFHPTSLYNPGERPSYLITEAMRGFGAVLKTQDGVEFMSKYDPRKSLAPRDIVARAIDNEMKISGDEFVCLDATHLDHEALVDHFPNIYEKCKSLGIDFTRDMIPVVPAAHFMCGGVKVDTNGESTIHHLYAVGETACTGLHGANRLASNSLLEGIVYAEMASRHSVEQIKNIQFKENVPDWNDKGTTHPEEMVLITQDFKEVQQIMSYYVGIVRSDIRLKRALDRLEIIYNETEELFKKSIISQRLCELRNLINIGYLVIRMAQQRGESRGLHYNIDHPKI